MLRIRRLFDNSESDGAYVKACIVCQTRSFGGPDNFRNGWNLLKNRENCNQNKEWNLNEKKKVKN